MGYSTDFYGSISIQPLVTEELMDELSEFFGDRHEDSDIGIWCNLEITPDSELQWNESEKTYNLDKWIVWLINNIFDPKGYTLNGKLYAEGERQGDVWEIKVTDNKVYRREQVTAWKDWKEI